MTWAAVGGGGAIALGIVVGSVAVVFVLRRVLGRRVNQPWAQSLAQRCAAPAYVVAGTAAAKISLAQVPATASDGDRLALGARLFGAHEGGVQHALLLLLIASVAWLAVQGVHVFTGALLRQIEQEHGSASTRVKRARTQVMLLQRVVIAVAVVVAIGAMLFSWQQVRVLGAGVLASAGVAGLIIGIAAQRAIGNLFSGLQLAFSDMLHVDDVLVVEGEWGQVEELTLSYVVIRIWDGRRLVMPVSYFTQTPFQNWTKRDRSIIGTVYLRLDWTVPVDELREHLHRTLREHQLWDGNEWGLVVTDITERGLLELRATMSAADGFASWTLNCDIRERMVSYVREHHPRSLPRVRADIADGRELD